MASKRLETAKKFFSHFEFLDPNILKEVLADNYAHEYAPGSISLRSFDKPGLIEFVSKLKTVMNGYPPTAKAILESKSGNAVTIWFTAQADWRDEAKDDGIPKEQWDYKGEYILLLYLSESGDQVVKTIEFLDSKATAEKMLGLVGRAHENVAKAR